MGADVMGLAIRGVLLAVGLWLILAPVAVYLVASDD
jgi:NhaP-type Na+/H+ and K+/H+ antiporter